MTACRPVIDLRWLRPEHLSLRRVFSKVVGWLVLRVVNHEVLLTIDRFLRRLHWWNALHFVLLAHALLIRPTLLSKHDFLHLLNRHRTFHVDPFVLDHVLLLQLEH